MAPLNTLMTDNDELRLRCLQTRLDTLLAVAQLQKAHQELREQLAESRRLCHSLAAACRTTDALWQTK